ncbi:MAG: hypothetical protein VB115_05030 [Christensenellaceae bacterium]|nr:hypothetical protein [Christensenellaceae bacterium]
MPLYEYYGNAQNKVPLTEAQSQSALIGNAAVVERIASLFVAGASVALDGWYGVDYEAIAEAIIAKAPDVECIHAYDIFKPVEDIGEYQRRYETEDPCFGWVNSEGSLEDLIDPSKAGELKEKLARRRREGGKVLVYGPGAAIRELWENYDAILYADFTMQPMLWLMWGGKLCSFGHKTPAADYLWKKYYYNDFYLLYRQKKAVLRRMDYYIEAVHADDLKMLDQATYQSMIDEVVKQPIKQVKILQPGPWGAYRYKDLWQVEGLECNAWNELAGIELSVLIDIGREECINIPSQNIMQRPVQMVGEYIHKTYPDLMPLQVWLDDGYFPEAVPFERSSMPIHDHPTTDYVRRNFNEPLGRYETYYIVESYKGSSTWMGYKETADLEEWERLCRESENLKAIPDWQDYVRRWDTNVGDLFLIPPGTSHGHGGNQMILEMDTGPSVAGTEYSFITYGYASNTWDDAAKTMTAKPMRMQLEHSFRNQKWIRETRAKEFHRARPVTVDGNGRFRKDRYTTIPEQPFHIERIFLEERAENDTEGKYMQIVTLTEGKRVTIRSLDHPQYSTTIERLQACVIPAGFGRHEYINEDGSHAMVVLIRMKKG